MTRTARCVAGVIVSIALAAGCEPTIVKVIGPANDEAVTIDEAGFHYVSENLSNVHDRRDFQWVNSSRRATIKHRSFVHHGSVLLLVRDSRNRLVDSSYAELEVDIPTDKNGFPGEWTISILYFGAHGRVDIALEPFE